MDDNHKWWNFKNSFQFVFYIEIEQIFVLKWINRWNGSQINRWNNLKLIDEIALKLIDELVLKLIDEFYKF